MNWLGIIIYDFLYLICKLSLPVFFSDLVVIGKSNIPLKGPCIIIGYEKNLIFIF